MFTYIIQAIKNIKVSKLCCSCSNLWFSHTFRVLCAVLATILQEEWGCFGEGAEDVHQDVARLENIVMRDGLFSLELKSDVLADNILRGVKRINIFFSLVWKCQVREGLGLW